MPDQPIVPDFIKDAAEKEYPKEFTMFRQKRIAWIAGATSNEAKRLHQQEWIDVRDLNFPEEGKAVNVCGQYGKSIITLSDTAYYKDGCWYDNSNDLKFSERFVTHWKPLPQPPVKEDFK